MEDCLLAPNTLRKKRPLKLTRQRESPCGTGLDHFKDNEILFLWDALSWKLVYFS